MLSATGRLSFEGRGGFGPVATFAGTAAAAPGASGAEECAAPSINHSPCGNGARGSMDEGGVPPTAAMYLLLALCLCRWEAELGHSTERRRMKQHVVLFAERKSIELVGKSTLPTCSQHQGS